MVKIISLTIIAIVLVGVAVFLYSGDTVQAPTPTSTPTSTPTPTPTSTPTPTTDETPTPTVSGATVIYSDSGYSPSNIRVNKGDTVVFRNTGTKMMWTASAVHPTHKTYPGSNIAFCGTPQSTGAFDACKGYGLGESWEFKFNEQGTWKYHNHMQANHTGTIIVE